MYLARSSASGCNAGSARRPLNKVPDNLPAFIWRYLKQHVGAFDCGYLRIRAGTLKILHLTFRHQIIAEAAQIKNRLG
jgi:hypothetical protein